MNIRGIVFDLDGTLLDHHAAATAALEAWVPTLGATLDDDLRSAWFASEETHFAAWRRGEIEFQEQRRRRYRDLCARLGHDAGPEAEQDAAFQGFLDAYAAAWTAYPDVEPCLDDLRAWGLPMVILTNGADDQQRAKVAAIGLTDRFVDVVTAGALGCAKPDPRSYLAGCDRLGLAPAACLHVGDDHALDVVGARAAGLRAIHLDRVGAALEGDRLTTLAELPARVAQMV